MAKSKKSATEETVEVRCQKAREAIDKALENPDEEARKKAIQKVVENNLDLFLADLDTAELFRAIMGKNE